MAIREIRKNGDEVLLFYPDLNKEVKSKVTQVAKVINPDYLIYGEKHNVGDSH